jgi:hypothetical protein
MATFPSNLGAVVCADESAFGEDNTTFDERLAVVNSTNEMTASLEQSKIPVPVTMQYQNDGVHDARGVFAPTWQQTLYLTGHGSTCAGAISATDLGTALGRWLGGGNDVTQTGTTVDSGASAIQFDKVGGVISAGSLIRVGALSDDRGNGQFYCVGGVASSTVTLLNAMEATPNAADVVYVAETAYPAEDDTAATVTTERYGIYTANQCYYVHGVYCSDLAFSGFNAGEIPQVTATMVGARTAASSPTWPTATGVDAFTPAPVSAGSFFYNTVGTTTLQTLTVRDVQFNVALNMSPQFGPGADDARQTLIGVRRLGCQGSLTLTVDSDAKGTDTLGDLWNASSPNYIHFMLTLSAEDGTAVGIYAPKAKIVGVRPTQHDMNGINAKTVTLQCLSGDTTTADITHSNFRIGLA